MQKFFIILFFIVMFNLPVFSSEYNIKYINLEWWENFQDKNLETNLLTLYEKNYDLKNAALKIKENEQIVKMQFAQELPFISFDGSLSRAFQGAREQFGDMSIPKYSQYNYNLPITAGYEIDIWGKNKLLTKSKKEQLEIIKQLERATYISLTSDFAADYFNLIKADEIIEIQHELIEIQQEILSKIKDKYKAGLCVINDVLIQEKILSSLQEELNLHLQAREILVGSLRVYLADSKIEIPRVGYENIRLINDIPLELDSDIVNFRPDYLIEETNLKRLGFDIRAAKREFLPTFTIFGQIGLNAYHLRSLFNSPSQFFTAGILPSLDLFSGGRKRAFLKMKKYQYEQVLNDYQKTFLVGVKEVNSGLIEYKTALKNYEEVAEKLKVEAKLYNFAKDKEAIGAASRLDTLFAKEIYFAARKEEVSSKINSIVSAIGLYKVTGGVNLYKIEKL